MRRFLWAASLAAFCFAPAADAQSPPGGSVAPTVNQRLTAPTSEADTYMGVSLGQLLLALGLTLKGRPHGLDEIHLFQVPQVAMGPEPGPDLGAPRR